MASVQLQSIVVLNNPTTFTAPFAFEISTCSPRALRSPKRN